MQKYYVQLGEMKATLFAEDALSAAVETIRWWGAAAEDTEITVFDRGFRRGAACRFASLEIAIDSAS